MRRRARTSTSGGRGPRGAAPVAVQWPTDRASCHWGSFVVCAPPLAESRAREMSDVCTRSTRAGAAHTQTHETDSLSLCECGEWRLTQTQCPVTVRRDTGRHTLTPLHLQWMEYRLQCTPTDAYTPHPAPPGHGHPARGSSNDVPDVAAPWRMGMGMANINEAIQLYSQKRNALFENAQKRKMPNDVSQTARDKRKNKKRTKVQKSKRRQTQNRRINHVCRQCPRRSSRPSSLDRGSRASRVQ